MFSSRENLESGAELSCLLSFQMVLIRNLNFMIEEHLEKVGVCYCRSVEDPVFKLQVRDRINTF